jgi:hypothetical protein
MSVFASIGLGLVGFAIGNLLFSRVGRWLYTLFETREKGARVSLLLLHDAPWLLIASAALAYYGSSQPWALPIYIGAAVAICIFGGLTLFLSKKSRKNGDQNAA